MHLSTFVEMVESGLGERPLLGPPDHRLTGLELAATARAAAAGLAERGSVVHVGENHPMLPVGLLAAAWAGIPWVPLNYRLDDELLVSLIEAQDRPLVLADPASAARLTDRVEVTTLDDWLASVDLGATPPEAPWDGDSVAVVLYTSGTTSAPKAALLRNRHLMAYLFATVEYASAPEDSAVLISVPPYHIAGVANALSNLFAGRRLVYLPAFSGPAWLETVRSENVTNAMVVPTMLARIVDAVGEGPADVPSLRALSYGGAKMPTRVLERALEVFPEVDFVNAYGLTETTSTIAVLGPEDHRAAAAGDPVARTRLGSAGRVVPGVEVEIRGPDDEALPPGVEGIIHLRGDQISGEYAHGSVLDDDGWFDTRDLGHLDDDGYLFVRGRADDTIIRGGENIAPAEIEEVLAADPGVAEVCVVGVPDDEWGQRIEAAVVPAPGATVDPEALRELVRSRLRGSKTPDRIVVRDEMPHTDTGKLLRRVVAAEMAAAHEEEPT